MGKNVIATEFKRKLCSFFGYDEKYRLVRAAKSSPRQ